MKKIIRSLPDYIRYRGTDFGNATTFHTRDFIIRQYHHTSIFCGLLRCFFAADVTSLP
jgi:hypothetical protein